MSENVKQIIKGGEIIETKINVNIPADVRVTKAFLRGRFGRDGFRLFRNIDKPTIVIYIHDADKALMSELEGDIVREIEELRK